MPSSRHSSSGIVALLALCAVGAEEPKVNAIRLPAHSAYLHPNPEGGASRQRDGRLTDWRAGTDVVWYAHFAASGELSIAIELAGEERSAGGWSLRTSPQQGTAKPIDITWPGSTPVADHCLPARTATITEPGYYSLTLTAEPHPASALPNLAALKLDGPAAKGAHVSAVERRNAASVHLFYQPPAEAVEEIESFYLELTPKTDPLWTY